MYQSCPSPCSCHIAAEEGETTAYGWTNLLGINEPSLMSRPLNIELYLVTFKLPFRTVHKAVATWQFFSSCLITQKPKRSNQLLSQDIAWIKTRITVITTCHCRKSTGAIDKTENSYIPYR